MRTCLIVVALILTGVGSAAWADEPPTLAKARALYNAGDFEGAIDAASVARKDEMWADAAALVVARAHLEQYRQRADAEDLAAARAALSAVRASALMPRDQVDLIVGPRAVAVSERDLRGGVGAVRHGAQPRRTAWHSAIDCCCWTGGRPHSIARRKAGLPIAARGYSSGSPRG